MGGDDFPSPGADYDPDAAMMQARATRDLQRQMQWIMDLLGRYDEEILVGGNGRKFAALVDLLGNDLSQRKWGLTFVDGNYKVVTGELFEDARVVEIANKDDFSFYPSAGETLYLHLEEYPSGDNWKATLLADNTRNEDESYYDFEGAEIGGFTMTKYYRPLIEFVDNATAEEDYPFAISIGEDLNAVWRVGDNDLEAMSAIVRVPGSVRVATVIQFTTR